MKKILFIMLVLSLFLAGCVNPNVSCPEYPEGKAMLDVEIRLFAINKLNENETFFNYWICNYGDKEAKDIKVRCKLIDSISMEIVKSVKGTFGNLASRSVQLGEIITDADQVDIDKEYIPICYVESCSNCEILYKRIPDLVESYEEE